MVPKTEGKTMTLEEKLHSMIEQLLKKSKENQVNWRRYEQNSFSIVFSSRNQLVVTASSPESEPDWARVALYVDGEHVAEIGAEDGDQDYELLKSVYDEAHRSVVGWDSAISAIEAELSAEGSVGVPVESDQTPF